MKRTAAASKATPESAPAFSHDDVVSLWREYDLDGVVFMRDDNRSRRNLTRLSKQNPAAWSEEWRRIKRDEPALAELLRDADFKATRELFDAEVVIDV